MADIKIEDAIFTYKDIADFERKNIKDFTEGSADYIASLEYAKFCEKIACWLEDYKNIKERQSMKDKYIICLLVDIKGNTEESKKAYILDRIALYNGEADLREMGKTTRLSNSNLKTTLQSLNDNISIVVYEYNDIQGYGDCVRVLYKHNNIIYTLEY